MSQNLHSVPEEGKVALVTGGARRLGATICQTLHGEGYRIVIHYNRSMDEAITLRDKLNTIREDSAITIQGDISVDIEKTCKDVVTQARDKWGRLDVLVNNASTFYKKSLEDTTEALYDGLMDTNAKAPFFLVKAAAPFLRETNGCIVNLGDCMSHRSYPDHMVYCISKAAIMNLTQSLAVELAPEVRVNCVAPGAASWPESGDYGEEFKQAWLSSIPMGRVGSFEDVAIMVKFLVDPQAANYVTGQIFNVDGGKTAMNG